MKRLLFPVALSLLLAACTQQGAPVAPPTNSLSGRWYEISFKGDAKANLTSSAKLVGTSGLKGQALTNIAEQLSFNLLSVDTFTSGNTRHIRAIYRVTNNTGQGLDHLTFVPLNTDEDTDPATPTTVTPTEGSTYFKSLYTYGNTDASGRATALTPVTGKIFSAAQGSAITDPEATPYTALDTSPLSFPARDGLVVNGLASAGWRLPTYLAPGASANITFAVDLAKDTPATDPFSFSVVVGLADDQVPVTLTAIHDIQGSTPAGNVATTITTPVTVRGIVTGDLQTASQLGGFFIQDPNPDADPNTSEGIFVYCGGISAACPDVNVGDLVQVSGTPVEFSGATQIASVTSVSVRATGQTLPAPISIDLPVDDLLLERYEGMRVTFPETLTVTNNFTYGRYGEVDLSNAGRMFNTTNGNGTPAEPQTTVTLDDGVSAQNPATLPYGALRTGATITGLSGVWHTVANLPMLEPEGPVTFSGGTRDAAPKTVGSATLRVAGANVLNYFTDLDADYSGTNRGANTAAEFTRQQTKIVNALSGLNADVLTLMEVENNGNTALQNLVDALNTRAGAGTYTFVNPGLLGTNSGIEGKVGTDAIHVAIIYKPASVTPVGSPMVDTNSVYSRPPVAQTFKQISSNGIFTVVANHLKSKGCTGATGANADQGDGQSCWNALRVQQAQQLLNFVTTIKNTSGDQDVLLMGDFNAYGDEDPIDTIVAGGFESLNKRIPADDRYSYQFGGLFGYLDHALASSTLSSQVTGITEWHINSDEPVTADYNTEFKNIPECVVGAGGASNTCQGLDLYDPATPYRASDHDPVLVGLNLTATTALSVSPSVATAGAPDQLSTINLGTSGNPTGVTVDWGDGSVETLANASASTASHTYANAGTYTVTVTATRGADTASGTTSISVVTPAISVSAAATPSSVVSGSSINKTITLTRTNYTGSVTLSATVVCASGQTCTGALPTFTYTQPNSGNSGTLGITGGGAGVYTVTLTASGAGVADATASFDVTVTTAPAGVNHLVISQVYGGGGNTNATYKNDFIELFNPTSGVISLSGYSVQYAGATGSSWQVTILTGSVQPGSYYLVQQAQGAGGTTSLPTPDATGTIAMSGTAGKVALVNTTTALTGTNPTGSGIVDLVGFGTTANGYEGTGATPAPSNTTSILRKNNGCTDSDNNSADFLTGTVAPRNSASPTNICP